MAIFIDPTALYAELANYHPDYAPPLATPECVAALIADTDQNDDPQRQGLDKLAAQTIRRLADALRPFAEIGVGTNPDYLPTIRLPRDAILTARAALCIASPALSAARGA